MQGWVCSLSGIIMYVSDLVTLSPSMKPLVWHGGTDHWSVTYWQTDDICISQGDVGWVSSVPRKKSQGAHLFLYLADWIYLTNCKENYLSREVYMCKMDNFPGYHRWMEYMPVLQNYVKLPYVVLKYYLPSHKNKWITVWCLKYNKEIWRIQKVSGR